MISFRFHVVSITAVFLAIAIGVVVGSTFVDRAIVDQLQDRIDGVSANLDERRAEIADLEDELGRMDDYADTSAAFAVSGRLAGQPVLLLAMRGTDDDAVRAVAALAGQAGATVPGILWVEPGWTLDDAGAVEELADLVDASGDAPEEVQAQAWAALLAELQAPDAAEGSPGGVPPEGEAGEPSTTSTETTTPLGVPEPPVTDTTEPALPPTPVVLPALVERGLLSFEPLVEGAIATDWVGSGPGVVLATAAEADAGLLAQAPVLVEALVDAELAVVVAEVYEDPGDEDADAPERGETILAAVPEGARTTVSMVDHLEQRSGQVAAVLALADLGRGVAGYYGFGEGSAGVIPTWTPLPAAPESP